MSGNRPALCKLPTETYIHSAAAVLRVFVEKSTTCFLDSQKVPTPSGKAGSSWLDFDIKLRFKIKAVLDIIDPKKVNKELKYARQTADGVKDVLHGLNMLNEYIHDNKALPAPSEVQTTWDRYHPYFEELFRVMSEEDEA